MLPVIQDDSVLVVRKIGFMDLLGLLTRFLLHIIPGIDIDRIGRLVLAHPVECCE
jgi:hypothetical protein